MPRTLLAAALVLFTAAVGFAQDKKDEKKEDKKEEKKDDKKDDKKGANLYPLAKGTKWEFTVQVMGNELEATQEVTEVSEPKKGERAIATIATSVGGQNLTEEMSADDKAVYRHAMQGQKLDTPIVAIKYPVKAGTKWTEKLKMMGQDVEADFETKKEEKVKVAAGEYTAVPVEMTIKVGGQTVTATNWYADGVGIVKQEMDLGAFKMTMELKKYTAGK
jgi:phage pi2 protein 07